MGFLRKIAIQKRQILKSRLAVIVLATTLGFGISLVHHAYHHPAGTKSGLLDSAFTACKSLFD